MQWVESHLKQPVAVLLLRTGLTANRLTVMGLLPCLLAAVVLVATENVFLAGLLFMFASMTDFFDGAMARLEKDHDYKFGAWFDTVVDRTSESIMLIGIMIFFVNRHDQVGQDLTVFGTITSLFVTYVKSAAEEKYIIVDWKAMEVQIFGRPGRVAILSIGMLATAFVVPAQNVLVVTLILFNALNVPVFIYRIWKIYKATIGRQNIS